ncbi:MAG: LPS export ABC transporter periplasmic protein LptC [Moraxella sp.]|nr:LPS export ABC transporter periplasmic protein LptC [Moraxella sp.]
MNAKIFALLGMMALMVGVWFFYKEDVKIKPATPQAPKTSYEITEITASQTSPETGQTEYTLTADSLIKNTNGSDEMVNAKIEWTPPNAQSYHLTASRASLDQATGELNLAEGFVLTRKGDDTKPDMVIKGSLLSGNTKDRTVKSDDTVTVEQGEDRFEAKGFVADLAQGEYEFHQIQLQFNPPAREDKPLF